MIIVTGVHPWGSHWRGPGFTGVEDGDALALISRALRSGCRCADEVV